MRPSLRVKRKWVVEPVGLLIEDLAKPIDGNRLFGNDHPLEVEIGSGKGTFLSHQAAARPHVNFVGLEKARRYWHYASDRLRRNGCLNTRMVLGDARQLFTELLADGCVAAVHIYFPDPWPKKRHHKRRLLQDPFLEHVERVLMTAGRLQVATDHEDYFRQIENVVKRSRLDIAAFVSPGSTEEEELVGSNFERKYRREGRPFYTIAAVKF